MRRVAEGDHFARVVHRSEDEVGQLARTLNAMLDDLEDARQTVSYLQKIGAWQDMARRIAHEIKNPLTPIQLAVQELREKYPGTGQPGDSSGRLLDVSAEIVQDEIDSLRRLVSSFSEFSKVPDVELVQVSVHRILKEFERAYGHLSDRESDRLEVIPAPPGLEILGDRQLLKNVLVNLVENSVLSAREAGIEDVHVRVEATFSQCGRAELSIRDVPSVEISVNDNGPGVAPERRETILEPYHTSRSDGSGLGLATAKKSSWTIAVRVTWNRPTWAERVCHSYSAGVGCGFAESS